MKNTRLFYIQNPEDHTMGNSLYQYIRIKLHHLIDNAPYDRIHVCGCHDRQKAIISEREKNDKLINWQRPTATLHNGSLYLQCFPGRDYVRHYASLVATHLALSKKNPAIVTYELPKQQLIRETLVAEGLDSIQFAPTVVIGKVEGCMPILSASTWTHTKGYIFATESELGTTLLGCKFSFWGDICAHLTCLLHRKGVRRMLFLGKLGSLRRNDTPNEKLSTGNATTLNGRHIEWANSVSAHCGSFKNIVTGKHITLYSVLRETKKWLSAHAEYDFVDPEIGHMANAAVIAGMEFSYLHIVSDNLAHRYSEDLSNERVTSVISKRQVLQQQINDIVSQWIDNKGQQVASADASHR